MCDAVGRWRQEGTSVHGMSHSRQVLLLLPKAAIQQFGGRTKGSSDGVLLLDQAAETVAKVGLKRPHQFGLRLRAFGWAWECVDNIDLINIGYVHCEAKTCFSAMLWVRMQ